ncbi:MAG: alpha/beta hydrolase-fold protein [Verrucomicrobia bacterium]|nr:alpha/beta hydrolase-fold protein [Verrucomicrobiota bacterium]MDA1066064.1 alpha/beta hydrolase-fold protein [Verrucomicrobiota bacterium]
MILPQKFSPSFKRLIVILTLFSCLTPGVWSQRDQSFINWVHETPAAKDLPVPDYYLHKTFQSKSAGQKVGYCIYLPPDYAANYSKRYPVIYNLHGNGGNEWNRTQESTVLHEGILDGRWPPMIMVFPNGGKSTFYKNSYDGKLPIETMFIEELIPHIDKTYRTIATREGRCIEGFSMGGRGSTRLAMKYPEMFCSLFCQAGNVPRISEGFDPSSPNVYPNYYLGPNKQAYINDDAYLLLEKNLEQIKKMRILIACGTLDDGHIVTIRDFHQALLDNGVDHTYWEMEGLKHERSRFIKILSPILYDYHVESLRLAGSLK